MAVPEPAPRDPTAGKRAIVAATITAALVAFTQDEREQQESWLREQLGGRLAGSAVGGMITSGSRSVATSAVIDQVIAQEQDREAVFVAKQSDRFLRNVTGALAKPDQPAREKALRGVMAREEQYVRARALAMAARAFAAVDRAVLRLQSPTGAFWLLDPAVREHTAGCLAMGRKFWPWQVLDRVHPPRHPGCPCRLVGFGEAIAEGLMTAGEVPNVRDAVRAAAAIVMEGAVEERDDPALLRDLLFEAQMFDVEDALMEAGATSRDRLDEARAVVELGQRVPEKLREVFGDAGLGRDRGGWFVYSHAERSKSYESPWEIPTSAVASVLEGAMHAAAE